MNTKLKNFCQRKGIEVSEFETKKNMLRLIEKWLKNDSSNKAPKYIVEEIDWMNYEFNKKQEKIAAQSAELTNLKVLSAKYGINITEVRKNGGLETWDSESELERAGFKEIEEDISIIDHNDHYESIKEYGTRWVNNDGVVVLRKESETTFGKGVNKYVNYK